MTVPPRRPAGGGLGRAGSPPTSRPASGPSPAIRLCLPTGDTPSPVYARLAAHGPGGPRALRRGRDRGARRVPRAAAGPPGALRRAPAAASSSTCCPRRRRRSTGSRPTTRTRRRRRRASTRSPPAAWTSRVLGLGMNGHVGLNEPGSYADARPASYGRRGEPPGGRGALRGGPGAHGRITLGMAACSRPARSGSWSRANARRPSSPVRSRRRRGRTAPATWLRRHPDLRVIADEPAHDVGAGRRPDGGVRGVRAGLALVDAREAARRDGVVHVAPRRVPAVRPLGPPPAGRDDDGDRPERRLRRPAGHDAWTIGDEPSIALDWEGLRTWATPIGVGERVLLTILFTDIVDSTPTAHRLGERAWSDLLARHNEAVRRVIANQRGREVETTGDGFLATFDGAARACRAAIGVRDERARARARRAGRHPHRRGRHRRVQGARDRRPRGGADRRRRGAR